MMISRSSSIFHPSVAHFVAGTRFRIVFPRLGRAIAWGYHSVRQLRRLVESFFQLSIWLRHEPRCVSVVDLPTKPFTTETERPLRMHRERHLVIFPTDSMGLLLRYKT